MSMPSIWELLLVVIVILLLFGAGKIPALMKDFGEGIKEFKKALKDDGKKEKSEKTTKPSKKKPTKKK